MGLTMGGNPSVEPPFDPFDGLLERIVKGSKKFFGQFSKNRKKNDTIHCSYCGDDLGKYLGGLYSDELKGAYCPPESRRECLFMEVLNLSMKNEGRLAATSNYLSLVELKALKKKGLITPPSGLYANR